MREHANIFKTWVLVAALVLALTPAPAYASTTDEILTHIWGELELMNDGLSTDSILYNVYNILNVELQQFGQMASVATSLGENGNIDVTLDGIWEATTNTYYLVDTITDHVSNLDTNLYSIGQTIGNMDTNLANNTNYVNTIKSVLDTDIKSKVTSIDNKMTTNNTRLGSILDYFDFAQGSIDYIETYTSGINTKLNNWANSGYAVDTGLSLSSLQQELVNIKNAVTSYANDSTKVLTVNTGLNLTPLLQQLVNVETAINGLVNNSNKVFTVDTGLNLNPLLQQLVNVETAINGLKTTTFDVDTGLNLTPVVTELTKIETVLKTGTLKVDTEWAAVDIAGMMLTQNSILSKLTDFYDYQRNYINSNLSSIYSELQLILGRWDTWANSGYSVNTGVSVDQVEYLLNDMKQIMHNINNRLGQQNQSNVYMTLRSIDGRVQQIVDLLTAWKNSNYPVTISNPVSAFDDTAIIQAINGLKGSVDAIHAWLLLGAVTDLVGDFDFEDLADKASALLDNASDIAPFAGFALIASLLAIWSGSGSLGEPSLQFDFEFFQPGDTVSIDLSWIGDALPLVHFLMISMLILCLVNSSMRIIELEATS